MKWRQFISSQGRLDRRQKTLTSLLELEILNHHDAVFLRQQGEAGQSLGCVRFFVYIASSSELLAPGSGLCPEASRSESSFTEHGRPTFIPSAIAIRWL